ncbi:MULTISPECIES: hypothetical protein [Microbacterium]|nr:MULTISPECIES: hypothetical protein [Microbacterium]
MIVLTVVLTWIVGSLGVGLLLGRSIMLADRREGALIVAEPATQ